MLISPDPVLLCNDLGASHSMTDGPLVHSDGRNTMSVKEAVQIARNNNLMGLICCQRLLVGQF